jgi:hypothetical protein
MRKIELNELSEFLPQLAGVIGVKPYQVRVKSVDSLLREYGEKYRNVSSAKTIEEAIQTYFLPQQDHVWSRHGELFVGRSKEAYCLREELTLNALRPLLKDVNCVVELGAGFGQIGYSIMKEFPHLRYIAGELTKEGRTLGEQLLPNIEFKSFNLLDEHWSIFDDVQNALVLTVHSVEMVPDGAQVTRKLREFHDRIYRVVHFEPTYEYDGSVLSLLRQRYIQLNGYCRNVGAGIPPEVKAIEADFFGLNPLFTETRIEWQPTAL